MRRAVLDPSVLVSALIKPTGPAGQLLAQVREAGLELIVSPLLMEELQDVLLRKKFRRYASLEEVDSYLTFITKHAAVVPDPVRPAPLSCRDPKDEYLLALAYAHKAILVSGDSDLLDLTGGAPICGPGDLTLG